MKHRNDLFSIDTNAKTVKGQAQGFMTGVMYLAPAKQAGVQVCPMAARAQCEAPCLFTAGRGAFNSVQLARINKTQQFLRDREWFMESVACSVETLLRKAEQASLTPVVRLNGTSDLPWEKFRVRGKRNIMQAFPTVQFYDYTKIAARFALCHEDNYDLTFSWSGAPDFAQQVNFARTFDARMAVVFRHRARIPETFEGMTCVDGDDSDLRFLDPQGVVVALYAKGRAKTSDSPLVVNN